MKNLARILRSSNQWPLLIALIFPIIVIVLGLFITNHPNGKLYLSLITACGGLGGVLSATRSPYMDIPHIEKPNRYVVGFLTDVLAGIAGAYIIIWIYPDHFILPSDNKGEPFTEIQELIVNVKIIAISIVGGYLGRALLERVGEDMIAKVNSMEAKVELSEKRIQDRFEIENYLSEMLYVPKAIEDVILADRFVYLLSHTDLRTRKYVFYRTMNHRFESSLDLHHIYRVSQDSLTHELAPDELEQRKSYLNRIRDRMRSCETIYRALIDSFTRSSETKPEPLYLYHQELAYSIKDALITQIFAKTITVSNSQTWSFSWREVQEHLESARKLLGKAHADKSVYFDLDKNEAICEIMLDENVMLHQKSPPKVVMNINGLLQTANVDVTDNEAIQFYPIREWLDLNND
jgi:hypothetical protein